MPRLRYSVTPEDVMAELDQEYFDEYAALIRVTLEELVREAQKATEPASQCLYGLWKNYSSRYVAAVLDGFARVERALFGLELGQIPGLWYRDHFVHTFNVFVFGARVLSLLLSSVPESEHEEVLFDVLQITPERKLGFFAAPYSAKKRLFFVWTLMSTFHDVGIPVQHLDMLRVGLNDFLRYFGLYLPEFDPTVASSVTTKVDYYATLMASMYDSGVVANPETGTYSKSVRPNPYLYNALVRLLDDRNHGVIGSLCLLRSIEDTFSVGVHDDPRYHLTEPQFARYVDLVLEHDITRAALAIALHGFRVEVYPQLFPLDVERFPLASLLILSDELQEYVRLEGLTLAGIVPLQDLPGIQVSYDSHRKQIQITVGLRYKTKGGDDSTVAAIMEGARQRALREGRPPPGDFQEWLKHLWDGQETDAGRIQGVADRLTSKLSINREGAPLHLRLKVSLHHGDKKYTPWFEWPSP